MTKSLPAGIFRTEMPSPSRAWHSESGFSYPKSLKVCRPTRGRCYLAIRSLCLRLLPSCTSPSAALVTFSVGSDCVSKSSNYETPSPNRSHSNFYESEGKVWMLREVYHDLVAREGNDWG